MPIDENRFVGLDEPPLSFIMCRFDELDEVTPTMITPLSYVGTILRWNFPLWIPYQNYNRFI